MTCGKISGRVLAVAPHMRGLGYAVFENPTECIGWGVKVQMSSKNEVALQHLNELSHVFAPSLLVLEDTSAEGSTRRRRIRELTWDMMKLADTKNLDFRMIPWTNVKAHFAKFGARTKHEIAVAIGAQVPALANRVPKPKMLWQSAKHSMPIFEAAALALTHYATLGADEQKILPV